jgi:hypothetical protein
MNMKLKEEIRKKSGKRKDVRTKLGEIMKK